MIMRTEVGGNTQYEVKIKVRLVKSNFVQMLYRAGRGISKW